MTVAVRVSESVRGVLTEVGSAVLQNDARPLAAMLWPRCKQCTPSLWSWANNGRASTNASRISFRRATHHSSSHFQCALSDKLTHNFILRPNLANTQNYAQVETAQVALLCSGTITESKLRYAATHFLRHITLLHSHIIATCSKINKRISQSKLYIIILHMPTRPLHLRNELNG